MFDTWEHIFHFVNSGIKARHFFGNFSQTSHAFHFSQITYFIQHKKYHYKFTAYCDFKAVNSH